MTIQVNLKIEIDISPDPGLWEAADEDSKRIYVKDELRNYIDDNFDDLIINSIKIVK